MLARIGTLSLDIGLVRSSELRKLAGFKHFEIQTRFTYSLFVQAPLAPPERDSLWVVQNVPMAVVGRYQAEFLTAASDGHVRPKVQLFCSTFPQARKAIASGYAAILPTASFSTQELHGIRKLTLPFSMPKFEAEETAVSVVWNARMEQIKQSFQNIISVIKSKLLDVDQKTIEIAPAINSGSTAASFETSPQRRKQNSAKI